MGSEPAVDEWTVPGPGGIVLYGRSWAATGIPRAATGVPRAAILIIHGLGEHSGRYAAAATVLAGAGFAAHALDYRGHGRSEGRRVHVGDVSDYVADVQVGLIETRRRSPGVPVFLLGHSQGGLIALKLGLDHPAAVDGLVITSPFLAVHSTSRPSPFVRAMAGVLVRVAPRLPMPTHIDVTLLSRDEGVGQAYARDPLVSHAASAGWLRAIGRAQRDVRARAGELRVPTLLMASGGDRLVDPDATRQFAREADAKVVEFVWWDGFYHEMLNDRGREQVLARIVAWLSQRTAGT
jgi:acylglycerol lipase